MCFRREFLQSAILIPFTFSVSVVIFSFQVLICLARGLSIFTRPNHRKSWFFGQKQMDISSFLWFYPLLFARHFTPLISLSAPKCHMRPTNYHHFTGETSETQVKSLAPEHTAATSQSRDSNPDSSHALSSSPWQPPLSI